MKKKRNVLTQTEKQMRKEQAEIKYPGYGAHARFLTGYVAGIYLLRLVITVLQCIILPERMQDIVLVIGSVLAGFLWFYLILKISWKIAIPIVILQFCGTVFNYISLFMQVPLWDMNTKGVLLVATDVIRYLPELIFYLYVIFSEKARFTIKLNYETEHDVPAAFLKQRMGGAASYTSTSKEFTESGEAIAEDVQQVAQKQMHTISSAVYQETISKQEDSLERLIKKNSASEREKEKKRQSFQRKVSLLNGVHLIQAAVMTAAIIGTEQNLWIAVAWVVISLTWYKARVRAVSKCIKISYVLMGIDLLLLIFLLLAVGIGEVAMILGMFGYIPAELILFLYANLHKDTRLRVLEDHQAAGNNKNHGKR